MLSPKRHINNDISSKLETQDNSDESKFNTLEKMSVETPENQFSPLKEENSESEPEDSLSIIEENRREEDEEESKFVIEPPSYTPHSQLLTVDQGKLSAKRSLSRHRNHSSGK